MHYRIIEPENDYAAQVLQDTLEWLESQEEMRRDYKNLSIACCSPGAPVTITRAPKPHIFAETNVKDAEKEQMETFLL
jgi:PHD/YefM family antitoxin component YafN of YafNO toxin-antitoxin module